MIVIRAFKLYGKTELESIRQQLLPLVNGWKSTWFISNADAIPVSIDAVLKNDIPGSALQADGFFCVLNDQTIDVVVESKALNDLLGAIINTPAKMLTGGLSDVSRSVVEKCLLDLISALANYNARSPAHLILIESSEIPVVDVNSGVVKITLAFPNGKLFIFVPHEIVRTLIGQRKPVIVIPAQPLAERSNCGFTENVTLAVLVGRTELEYGAINNLCVGDVITLDSKIDEPVAVVLDYGMQLCHAYVGKTDTAKVAKVIFNK